MVERVVNLIGGPCDVGRASVRGDAESIRVAMEDECGIPVLATPGTYHT